MKLKWLVDLDKYQFLTVAISVFALVVSFGNGIQKLTMLW